MLLHAKHGFVVMPLFALSINGSTMSVLKASLESTMMCFMFSSSATFAAAVSSFVEHDRPCRSPAHRRNVTPVTSCPWFFSSQAVTFESTPPDRPTSVRMVYSVLIFCFR